MLNAIAGHLERYMDLLASRQKLVASNIANAATPGYRTKDIDFQFEFLSAVDGGGTQPPQPNVIEAPGLKTKNDGNNVGLDRESRLLAENAIRFNVAASLWKVQARMVRSAIQEAKNG